MLSETDNYVPTSDTNSDGFSSGAQSTSSVETQPTQPVELNTATSDVSSRVESSPLTPICEAKVAEVGKVYLKVGSNTNIRKARTMSQKDKEAGEKLLLARQMVQDAVKFKKIFLMETNHTAVRQKLRADGWIENLESNKSRDKLAAEDAGLRGIISRLIRNLPVNFVWTATRRKRGNGDAQQLLNSPAYLNFNTKSALVQTVRNVAVISSADPDAIAPRSYRMHREKDANLFYRDFILTACVNILKYITGFTVDPNVLGDCGYSWQDWTPLRKQGLPKRFPLSARLQLEKYIEFDINEETYYCAPDTPEDLSEWLARDVGEFPSIDLKKPADTTTLPDEVVRIAAKHIKEFLAIVDEIIYQSRLKKLRFAMSPTHNAWNSFLHWSYLVRQQHLKGDSQLELPVDQDKVEYCRKLLRNFLRLHPAAAHDGVNNVWIVKPGNKSRGVEITVCDTVEDITEICFNNLGFPDMRNFVVQKYIERPFLCHKTKFDVRQWFLVVWHPLSLWMYSDCYLRFSSSHYTLSDFTEKVHLTNNAIQGKYFHTVPSGSGIPDECMWHRDQFIKYLSTKGFNGPQLWNGKIFPEITRQLTAVLIASAVEMDMKAVDGYELFGADFVLSENLKPWLIEINSGPDLSSSTNVTANLCPGLIIDCLKVLIDRQRNHEAKTGKFRLVHQIDYAKNTKAFRERSGVLETMKPIRQHRQAIARSRGLLTALPPGVVKLSPEGTKSLTYQVLPVQDDIKGHYANSPAVQDAVRELRREKAHSSFQARSLAIIKSCIESKSPSKAVMRVKRRVIERPFSRISGMSVQGDDSSTAESDCDSDDDSVDNLDVKSKAAMTLQARVVDAQRRYLERIKATNSARHATSKPAILMRETTSDPLPPRKFNRQRIAELAKPKIFAHIQSRKLVKSSSSDKRTRIFSAARVSNKAQIIGDAKSNRLLDEVVEEKLEVIERAQENEGSDVGDCNKRSETQVAPQISREAEKPADVTQSVLTLNLDSSIPLSAAFVSESTSVQKVIDYYTQNPTNSIRLHSTIRAMLRRYLPNAEDPIRTLDAFYRNPMDATLKRRVRDTMNTLMNKKNYSDRKEITLLSAFRKRDTASGVIPVKNSNSILHRYTARVKRSAMENMKDTSGPVLAPLKNILALSYVGD